MKGAFAFPVELLFDIEEGRYAVSAKDSNDLTFLRLSIIKPRRNGRRVVFQDWMKIQTQHSEDLILRFIVAPGHEEYMSYSAMTEGHMARLLARVVVDPWGAAMRYGQELGQCCRCGRALTDERSRWYGIGPDCEQVWSNVISESDERRGVYAPSVPEFIYQQGE